MFDSNCQETEVDGPAIAPSSAFTAAYVGCDDDDAVTVKGFEKMSTVKVRVR